MALPAAEFLLLFFVLPALFAYTRHRVPPLTGLWILTAYCLFVMSRDPRFAAASLWDASAIRLYAARILTLFAGVAVIGIFLVRKFAPRELFFGFPRSQPRQWGLLMVLYPLLSVYPQGIVYRAFIFERYRDLFRSDWEIVAASALAFTFAHIVYRNRLALGLSLLGGLLFAARYLQTGSLLVSSFEHALYGCALFTLGIGQWFHHASVRHAGAAEAARLVP